MVMWERKRIVADIIARLGTLPYKIVPYWTLGTDQSSSSTGQWATAAAAVRATSGPSH